jgi:hypothetical protein
MKTMTQNERQQLGPFGMIDALSKIDSDAEVWEGESRDWVIGEMPDPDDGEYEMIATVGELLAEYREAIA